VDLREQFEMALEEELKSASFYCELADRVKDPTLKAILLGMVGDKYGHAKTLTALLIDGS